MGFMDWLKSRGLRFEEAGSFPRPEDPNVLGVGKTFITKTGDSVVAERIVGNIENPKNFEITAKGNQHIISMLEFYCQLRGERPNPEEIEDWDSIELLKIAPILKKEKNGKETKTEN